MLNSSNLESEVGKPQVPIESEQQLQNEASKTLGHKSFVDTQSPTCDNHIINAVSAEAQQTNSAGLLWAQNNNAFNNDPAFTQQTSNIIEVSSTKNLAKYNNFENNNDNHVPTTKQTSEQLDESLANKQLSTGLLQIFEPPLAKARGQLKELIGKQNKIYIDLSAEKFKLDNAETARLHEMMNNVKVYREKLVKIKKQMQNIYQRTKVLKKRAFNVQACKQKELQRKLQKQQQEEALIGKQQHQQRQRQREPTVTSPTQAQ